LENDVRPPSSFRQFAYDDLVVRQDGFDSIRAIGDDGKETDHHISNWESYAQNYWFETRFIKATCPTVPKGIATIADWALMVPCLFGDMSVKPRIIFVETHMLPHFIESIFFLRGEENFSFVLVSGGGDMTVPRSVGDVRYHAMRGFNNHSYGGGYFKKMIAHLDL
jgi:hypothetical protein